MKVEIELCDVLDFIKIADDSDLQKIRTEVLGGYDILEDALKHEFLIKVYNAYTLAQLWEKFPHL